MKTIVVATDGSDLAIRAASTGSTLLGAVDKVYVVMVAETVDPSLADDATGFAAATMTPEQVQEENRNAMEGSRLAVEETVTALGRVEPNDAEIETHVIEGDAGPALCDFAASVGATAIVVGSRGRGGIKRAILGSVSDYIVRHAPCSVVVTRDPE